MTAERADVVVLGGGLTGLALAAALGSAGVRTVVLERGDWDDMLSAPFDGRVTAIARGSRIFLDAVGAFAAMSGEAEPILDIVVHEAGSPVRVFYEGLAIDGDPLGWIVENRVIRRALHARVGELADVRLRPRTQVAAIDRDLSGVDVRLADGETIRASLLCVCEGRMSATRERLGIPARRWDYGQTAIVCTLAHEKPHFGLAIERFFPDGPFALLPMQGDRSSIVWALEAERAAAVLALDDADFLAEVAERFGDHLGEVRLEGPRWHYPLVLVVSERYTDRRVALVGDAARGIHPIAGQGWNLALRDVAAIAETVVDRLRLGLDPGDALALEAYESWRRFDGLVLVAVTDGINRLFANDLLPLKLARNLGLFAVERLPPLKRFFMRHAMGLVGDLPRTMRGEPL
jgi:2-octaprenyl-6-methoxyphenol hydroxylase